jgi:heat shock protein HslJ
MSKTFTLALVSMAFIGLLLAACAPQPAAPQPQGTEPAAPEATPAGVEKTVYVGPAVVDCEGVAPQKCLQVKEKPDEEYRLFYSSIEGFEYEEGYEYQLVVREEPVANPPADAPNFTWTLVSVVSKTPASPLPVDELPADLYALEWYQDEAGEQAQIMPGTQITLKYADGRVAGSSGCNQYSASIEVNGNLVSVGQPISTMMACEEAIMKQEGEYLATLQKAASFELDGENLVFLDKDGTAILSFAVLKPVPLVGTSWQLLSYNNGTGGLASALAGTSISAVFGEDGTLAGSAGCNNYTARFEVDGDQITIGPAATTRMMCNEPEGIMEQETQFLLALQSAKRFAIEADRLTLFDESGTKAVEFQADRLVGAPWYLAEIQYSNDTVKTPDDPTKYSLKFVPEGILAVVADCNQASGTYTTDGPQLSIQLGPTTLAACPPESLSDEYLGNLGDAVSYQIEGDALYIAMKMDAGIMKFTRMP